MSTGSRRIIVALVMAVVLVALSGCQTMAGWFGLATEQYVEEQMADVQTQVDSKMGTVQSDVDVKLGKVQTQIDEYAMTADQLEGLIGSLEESVRTTEELKQLAVVLEERLVNLPEETIKQLVDILQQYLESR